MSSHMHTSRDWKLRLREELRTAKEARTAGNGGKARVCAHRAAGVAIGEYLRRQGIPDPRPSAYDRLHYLALLPKLSARARQIAEHLLLRVNEDFKLPNNADLIAETDELVELLLGQSLGEE